jgi:hypothetical protein
LARGDAICRKANRRAKTLNERAVEATSNVSDPEEQLAALDPIFTEGLVAQKESAREFEQLVPPDGDEAQFEKMVDYYRQQNALVSRLADAAHRRDVEAFKAINAESQRLTGQVRAFLQGYGFHECGSGKNEAASG